MTRAPAAADVDHPGMELTRQLKNRPLALSSEAAIVDDDADQRLLDPAASNSRSLD